MVSESVFILLGSNQGNREQLLHQAYDKIGERCGRIVAQSPVYESEPWGFEAQQWFLNQVLEVATFMTPDNLMLTLLDIEKDLGRDRVTPHKGYASRPMDLDILYFGNRVIDTQLVTAPHPRLHQRRFTLLPLCDLAPDFKHPTLKKTNRQILDACDDLCNVKLYKKV